MLALHFLLPLTRVIPSPWNLLGIIPLAGGIALNIIADNAFRKAETTVKPFEQSTALMPDLGDCHDRAPGADGHTRQARHLKSASRTRG
jgi:hypothetical protein